MEKYHRSIRYDDTPSKAIAVIEPFAVLYFLHLDDQLQVYPELMQLFTRHIRTCLTPGACVDTVTGGLRLSSTSSNTWPSKGVLCPFVLENIFGINIREECPALMRELLYRAQVSAAEKTIPDQIYCGKRTAIGASYYPRIVTASLWAPSKYQQCFVTSHNRNTAAVILSASYPFLPV